MPDPMGTLPHPFAGLHVLADDDPRWSIGPVTQAAAACEGGAAVVQLRAKFSTDGQVLDWAREIRALTRNAGVRFVMNDRFDLALAAEADGVHLGRGDIPLERIPAQSRAKLAVGLSSHDLGQAAEAAGQNVDYVAFGPVFGTASKDSPYTARGLHLLEAAVKAVAPTPLIAIGGITCANIAAVADTGAAGAAVISAVAGETDPVRSTRQLAKESSRMIKFKGSRR